MTSRRRGGAARRRRLSTARCRIPPAAPMGFHHRDEV
jgi:hypothetical protein